MRITQENYVEQAEKVILAIKQKKEADKRYALVSTTKIRGLLSMIADIYNEIMSGSEEILDEKTRARLDYLRVRFVYESGREPSVKNFVLEADLLNCLKSIQGKKSGFILFYHYMEALVAYFKFNNLDESDR